MPKRRTQLDGVLGPLESEVMEAVWTRGDTTVRDVHETLALRRDIAYTTVMTTMSRLAAKGLLIRDTSGLAHHYRAGLSRDEYAYSTVHSVVDWLVNSFPESAISYFLDVVDTEDPAVVDALRASVERLREREG
ncbi:MAG: BlaI/MecI/CopY family transcriptional regulator [Actinomycetota bacterium]|nr:BlaI/MecI/CopY family transcriptional regulator [Actinomycetota bacterium]